MKGNAIKYILLKVQAVLI